MSLAITEEQSQFVDTVRTFFADQITSSYLRQREADSIESDPKLWKKIIELGLVASFASEGDGGVGLGVKDLALLAFEAGRALLPEPLIESALFGSCFLSRYLSPSDRKALVTLYPGVIEKVTGGDLVVTALPSVTTTLTFDSKKSELSGTSRFVPFLKAASFALAPAENGSEVQICLIDLKSKGIRIIPVDGLDHTVSRSDLDLKGVSAILLSSLEFNRYVSCEAIALASQIAGASDRAVSMTKEHVSTRKQFDVPIGGFQAVQHRLADMYLHTEAIRALSRFAAWSADSSPEQLSLAARSTLLFALQYGASIIEGAIQLHGGIGFTWEYDLHLLLRRVKTIDAIYGSDPGLKQSILRLAASS